MSRSIQPEWCRSLPLQQQSVLLLATRGPDGIGKQHPVKDVLRAYRACVLTAAKWGRPMKYGEAGDGFMSLDLFGSDLQWAGVCDEYMLSVDSIPHHFVMHLLYGAEILGYKHPDVRFRDRWRLFYVECVRDLHLTPETEEEMDERLNDWGRESWED